MLLLDIVQYQPDGVDHFMTCVNRQFVTQRVLVTRSLASVAAITHRSAV